MEYDFKFEKRNYNSLDIDKCELLYIFNKHDNDSNNFDIEVSYYTNEKNLILIV